MPFSSLTKKIASYNLNCTVFLFPFFYLNCIFPYPQQIIKCDYCTINNCIYNFSGILSHTQLCPMFGTSITTRNVFLVGGSYFLHPSIICANRGTKYFRLEPWWDFLHRRIQPSCQWLRETLRLCQLKLFPLEHSGPRLHKLQSL